MQRSATPIKKSQDERTKEFPGAKEKTEAADPSHSTSGGSQHLSPHQRAAPTLLGGASMMRQEADLQLDSLCSSGISQHDSFLRMIRTQLG
jgi:hypothetical protein